MASQLRYAELFNPRLQSAMHTNEPTHCAHFGFVFDTQLTWIPFPIRIRTRWFGFGWWKRNQRGHRHTDRREGPVVVTFCFWVFPAPFRPIFAKNLRLNGRLRCLLVIYYITRLTRSHIPLVGQGRSLRSTIYT